jgi:hypothetical protein
MNTLLLKLILTPSLIGAASLAGRRWGDSISGWLIALPLTTGPITFFLALSHGTAFAATSAAGTLAGGLSQAAFLLSFAHLAQRWKWLPTLAISILAYAAFTAVLQQLTFSIVPLYVLVFLVLLLVVKLLPRQTHLDASTEGLPPRWDIPARMTIATVFVILITSLAPGFGPRLTGLLSPFPLFTSILAIFALQQHGADASVSVVRGVLMGLFSFASFFFTLAILLVPAGILVAFIVAILVEILFQAFTLWLLQRQQTA